MGDTDEGLVDRKRLNQPLMEDEDKAMQKAEGLADGSEELELVAEIREILHRELSQAAQHADVIGDLRILRTLRKHDNDVEVATEDFRTYLAERYKNGMDDVRESLVGKPYSILSLPHGKEASKYFPAWDLDAGSTPHGDVVHYYGVGQPQLCAKTMDLGRLKEFYLGLFEMTSMQLHAKSTLEDPAKLVMVIDMRDYLLKVGMYQFFHEEIMPICETMLADCCRAVYIVNAPQIENKTTVEDHMQHMGIGVPGWNQIELFCEHEDFLLNERLLSDLDIGVLQRAIVPALKGLADARGVTDVPKWNWMWRVVPVYKGQEISWDVSLDPTVLRDATIKFSATLYMSPGEEEGIYPKIVMEELIFSESDGQLCGEFHVQDDGIFVLKLDNMHSWFRWKTVRYNVEDRRVGKEVDTRDGKGAPTIDEVEMYPTGAESDAESDVGLN